ncbi:MAG: phosphoribosylanthranilate isomerase [Phenylobacterium sp.]|uniref:phosphoribosylanthranilate isomerase n=1 Tax=Phenylobacterium sp. TaxID=1871053 RepID=UPI001A4B0CB0|nr:phosphoribosylanthranilate isomerase [Phenylobacterium sp.]MBL8770502.1 phosphoribosylanthranilate isomerase [Phenylobacterium sp.]
MAAQTKICGVTTPEAVQAALDGRTSFLGFMFFERSPRNIAPDAAARLAPPARAKGVRLVAVTVDPSDDELDAITRHLAPDLIQLHGHEPPGRVREVLGRTGAGVIKVLPVAEAGDLAAAAAYEPVVDHLMFETKPPKDADRPGGRGVAFDWTLMKGRRFQKPWFLAGGLNPWNVAEAITASGAPIVDVSSGVERGPGLKDPALITAFLDAVRRA